MSNLKVLNLFYNDVIGIDYYNVEIFWYIEFLEMLVIDGLWNGNFDFKIKNKRCVLLYEINYDIIELIKFIILIVFGWRNCFKCLVMDLLVGFFDSVFNIMYLDMFGCVI